MLEVLVNPNRFFEARIKEEESLKTSILIVLISGLVGGIIFYFLGNMMMKAMSEALLGEAHGFTWVMSIGSIIGCAISSFIIWLIESALFFGISCLFKGQGKFKRTLEFLGFSFIPLIINEMISAALFYILFTTVQIQAVTNPAEMGASMGQLMKSPTMILSFALGILFVLWRAYILIFGLKYARNLSTRNAIISVATPVGLYLAFQVWQLVRVI